MSLACNIQLVRLKGPGDLSASSFLISFLSSSGVTGAINRGCVMFVVIEACSSESVWEGV